MRNTHDPSISELRAFVACMDRGSVTAAAGALSLTQSTISRSIALLETKLGLPLFHRVRQRLVPSDAGRLFAKDARAVLLRLEEATVRTMAFGGRRDVVNLAVLPTFATRWLTPRLPAFSALEPEIGLDISARLMPTDFEAEAVEGAVIRCRTAPPGQEAIRLLEDELVAVASPGLLKATMSRQDGETVAVSRLPLLQQSTRPTLWLEWFREAGLDARDILRGHRFDQFAMVVEGAIAGLGVALVPDFAVDRELAAGTLVLAADKRLRLGEPYQLVHPRRSLEKDAFRRFADWLSRTARSEPVRSATSKDQA